MKKFFSKDTQKRITAFRHILNNAENGKFELVNQPDYFKLYQYYFDADEAVLTRIKSLMQGFDFQDKKVFEQLNEVTKSLDVAGLLVFKDFFYLSLYPVLKKISYNSMELIMDWYGNFCLENCFFGDYKIMTNYFLNAIYYGAHSSTPEGKEIRRWHNDMLKKVEEKLNIRELK